MILYMIVISKSGIISLSSVNTSDLNFYKKKCVLKLESDSESIDTTNIGSMASSFGCYKQRHKRITPCTKSDVGYKNNNYYKSTNILFIHIILSFIDIINSSIRQAKYKKQVQFYLYFI